MATVGHSSTIRTQRGTADDGCTPRPLPLPRDPWPPRRGTLVVLKNMPGRRHLNGLYGHIVPGIDGSMKDPITRRARVQLCGAPYTVKVLPENVDTCEDEPVASACWPSMYSAREGDADAVPDSASEQIIRRSDVQQKLRSDRAALENASSVPSTPRTPATSPRAASRKGEPRKCSARGGRMFGEAYAKIQAASREPRRLRHHGMSFFRDQGHDWHPASGSAHLPVEHTVTTPIGYDWRTVRETYRYTDPNSIPHEKGGFQTPRDRGQEEDILHPKLKQLLFSGAGRVHLTSRESSAPSYFSSLSLSGPLDLNTSFLGSMTYPASLEEDSRAFEFTPSQSTALPHNASHAESNSVSFPRPEESFEDLPAEEDYEAFEEDS